jgi:hypothetical protein
MQKKSLTRCGKAVSVIRGPLKKSFDDFIKTLLYPCTLFKHLLLIMTAFQTLSDEAYIYIYIYV